MLTRLCSFILIRDKEYGQVAYFFCVFFLIGCGMALGRGTADALFFKRYGIEYLPVMYIVVSLFLCLTSVAYAAFADRIPSERFFNILFASLIALLLCNWALIAFSDTTLSYPVYFLVYEIASELLTVHAAHYLSQNFEMLQVKRLSPLIMAGTQLGVIVGGIFLASTSHALGVQNFLLIWSLLLAASLVLISLRHKTHGASPYFRPRHTRADKLGQAVHEVQQGLKFIRSSNLLRALSFSLFFLVITFYVLCYSANRIYTDTFQSEESLTMFFGILTATTSTIALLLQIFVTNRLLRRFGARRVNLIFPVTSIFSYFALLVSFSFASAVFASLNKDAIMTAFRNPVRNLFFNALPENMQGRARATSVVVVLPLALTASGLLLWLAQHLGNPLYFVALGLTAATCYLFFSNKMSNAYASEMALHLKHKLFIPEQDKPLSLQGNDESLFAQLSRGLENRDNQITLDFSRMLVTAFPERAPALILQRIDDVDNSTKDQLFKLVAPVDPGALHRYLWKSLQHSDSHLRSTILKTLFSLGSETAQGLLADTLRSDNPRVQAAGIYGVFKYGKEELYPEAMTRWKHLVTSASRGANLAAVELLECFPDTDNSTDDLIASYKKTILRLLKLDSIRVKQSTLRSLEHWPEDQFHELDPYLAELYQNEEAPIRIECLKLCHLLPAASRDRLVDTAIEDSNADVRDAAVSAIIAHAPDALALLTSWLTTDNRGSPRAQQAMLKALLASDVSKDLMEAIALSKAKDAQQILHAAKLLSGADRTQNSALELMRYTLDEKFMQIIDLILLAMQALEHQEDISVLRAAIKSRDPRHTANAFEVLHSMRKQRVAQILCDILDEAQRGQQRARKSAPPPFHDMKSMLLWCRERVDPWLQECAAQALKSLG
jgi:MFS family permease/HEAT repeat protein